jgi:hypothetical protein
MKIIIFGSNEQGFHGAGSAGYAMRGDYRNNWREDKAFLAALNGSDKRGKWATLGVGRGFQTGRAQGGSYAIATVTRPGAKRSVSVEEIRAQVDQLLLFMREHPDWLFGLTHFGVGYAGWEQSDMLPLWDKILAEPNATLISVGPTKRDNS